jgi:hypothetical protein
MHRSGWILTLILYSKDQLEGVPARRNGSRITVPTACAVAPSTLSGSFEEVVVSVVLVVVLYAGGTGSVVVVVFCTV